MEGTTVSLTAKAPPIVSTATGSAAPEYNPNDPMSRGFGVGGKKSVTEGLPSHSGSGGAGSTSRSTLILALTIRFQRRDIHRRHFEHSFHPLRSFRWSR